MDLFQASFRDISDRSQKSFFLELVFVKVRVSELQTFEETAMQRVLFEHLFLCDHFQKCICSVAFIKGSSTMYVFLDVFQSFVVAISPS